MTDSKSPILVLGDGGWGTALAAVLHEAGHPVRVWGYDEEYTAEVSKTRENRKFLPGFVVPEGIEFGSNLQRLKEGVEVVFSVVPTQFLRTTVERIGDDLPADGLYVSCSKGFERGTLERPSAILAEALPQGRFAVLSGPSHAEEVSRKLPTAVVVAASAQADAVRVQELVKTPFFRAYTSDDPCGVEVAGAAKNVIAVGAGIVDGLGLGDNSRAGLICRGAHEITRLGVALGAQQQTFAGLAGVGDLIATCTSTHSRNHTVGFRVGRGESLESILASTEKVAEGVETTRSMKDLATREGVELPITQAVHDILFGGTPPAAAVDALMRRELKGEFS